MDQTSAFEGLSSFYYKSQRLCYAIVISFKSIYTLTALPFSDLQK